VQVLLPLMGFCRNYHGFLFMDKTDGAVFTQCSNSAIDMQHLSRLVINAIDLEAENLTLGHFLSQEGDELGFLYDMGDTWSFTLRVVDALTQEESTGQVQVGSCNRVGDSPLGA
jgi:Plasmid pRiA4b ORF-3-like protein